VNAAGEEVLWRGTYARAFPGARWLGYVWPALGFGLWHIAPQTIFPNQRTGGAASFVAFATLLGALFGWVAWRSGSIRWTTLVHVLFDFSGLGALIYAHGAGPDEREERDATRTRGRPGSCAEPAEPW